MTYQFQCPFCGVAIEADAVGSESTVQCPSCTQSFVVETPAEPVRVRATVVPHAPQPPVHAQAPHPQRRVIHEVHRKPSARRDEARAKFAMIALLVGAPLLLGLLVWIAMSVLEQKTKVAVVPPEPDKQVTGKIDGVIEETRQLRILEAAERDRIKAVGKLYEAKQAGEEQERLAQEEQGRAALSARLARDVFGGDKALADEAVREFGAALLETRALYEDGIQNNEPADFRAEVERNFARRLTRNKMVAAWSASHSLDPVARIFGGRPLTGPDGKPVDPNSIQGMLANFKYSATGSGFWISRDGWLLTNAHVVGSSASVDLCDATGAKLTARVVKSDPVKDLALLKVETTRTTWLPIYGGGDPPVGTPVFTAGYPKPTVQGLESKVTSGEINSHSGMRDNKDHYQCSVPIQPGNSGGALVEGTSGLCVGIVVATLRSQSGTEVSQNVNYAIKPGVARAFVETVPEAKPLLLPAAGPKALPKAAPNANPALSNQPAIQRARECAVLILVK